MDTKGTAAITPAMGIKTGPIALTPSINSFPMPRLSLNILEIPPK
jgi:hypothetical protein